MKSLRAAALTIKTVLLWIGLLLPLTSLAGAQTLNDPNLQVEQVVEGLSFPTNMAFIGPDDILILQKGDGRVRRVLGGVLQPGQVLDVAVDNSSERGLLGIAVHPDFPGTPSVYLYYTESSTGNDTSGSPTPLGNRVYRYTWDGSALINPTLILDLPVTPGPNHDGGIIIFGPDDKLYVVIGDLNRNGQLQNFPTGLPPDDTGVILRLNDDGTIPSDNPFFAEGGNLAKYYAYGIRNSFGMAFDPVTGKLWNTENGPDTFDEINLVEPGFNSGWEQIMGPDARDPQGVNDLFLVPGSQYTDPKFSWFDTVGPTAILFLDSARLGAQYQNDIFVGDINNGTLYHFEPNGTRDGFEFRSAGLADLVADNDGELQELIFGTGFGGITDLKVGPGGPLYILSFSLGKIFRVFSQVEPVISVTPGSQDFGNVNVGSFADRTFTVQNTGGGTLNGSASTSDPFSIESVGSYSLGAGSSQIVTARFSPTSAGAFMGNVTFTGAGGSTRILTGTGFSTFTLTVAKTGSGDGTVTSSPAGINCGATCQASFSSSTSVTLTAAADPGSSFAGFSGGGCSGTGPCTVIVNADTTVTATYSKIFTDDPLTSQVTPVKTLHITELRQAINTLRSRNSLLPFVFTDSILTAGVTPIRAVHITEMRTTLDAVFDALVQTRPVYADSPIVSGQTVIKKVHIEEIRSAVRTVE